MSRWAKVLTLVLRGTADQNIRFDEIVSLLRHLGFDLRIKGSHHIFSKSGVKDILNLQPKNGMAKAYQVKAGAQFDREVPVG
jgi:predicted RNA binding protein YcfA (HicA-like mRNA interferase family)